MAIAVLAIALIGAGGAVAAGCSPTGDSIVDAVLVGLAVLGVVWAAASSPWWAGVMAAIVAMVFAPSALLLAVGALAAGGGLVVGLRGRAEPWTRALVAALAVQVFARLGEVGGFGVSAAIAISTLFALTVVGLSRRPRRDRRIAFGVAVALVVATVLALIGGGLAAASARDSVEDGVDRAQQAVDQLAEGDFDAARASFHDAAELLAEGDAALARPWTQPARLVPVVAQYRAAGTELVGSAADVTGQVASALDRIDPDALRVRNGAIDVSAVEALQQPMAELLNALDQLVVSVQSIDNPWLSRRLTDRLDELVVKVEDKRPKGDDLLQAVEQIPTLLGRDGLRRYFVAFTTPVEARGLGGFMGNWAEVTLDRGKIAVTKFGRHDDLNNTGAQPKTITGPADFLATWGDRGFRQPDGGGHPRIWSDVTMSPQFPSVAQVISEMYPQSGGQQLDGVFAMDVYTIAALMQITGSVDVPSAGVSVTPENAAEFLLHDQYLQIQDTPQRVDALEIVAKTTIDRLLTSDLPGPVDMAELLAPYVSERRLMGWSPVPAEQAVMTTLGADGALPVPGTGDAAAVVVNNAGNSKIDYYLDGRISYDVTTGGDTTVTATLTIDLTNSAPAEGEPNYVIGNSASLPNGTNYLYVTGYGALPIRSATVDGVTAPFRSSVEAGLNVASLFVQMPPGGGTTIVFQLDGQVADPAAFTSTLEWRSPPSVRPMPATITLNGEPMQRSPVNEPGMFTLDMLPR
jgi:hypothetical protein